MHQTMVVLPTYNEAENLTPMIEALVALPVNILVVDDNSPDGTGALAEQLAAANPGRITVMHRTEKSGLGKAYIAGFTQAMSLGAEYLIQMDADFSHQPKYIPDLIAKLDEGYDLVIGSRYARGGGVDETWGPYRKLLSWFANAVYVRVLLGLPISDATAGYRIWRRETLIGMGLDRIQSNGYVFQVEMAYVAFRLGFKITEIPIYFPDRKRGTSKMGSWIVFEAALRVWELLYWHHSLTPQMRHTEVR